MRYDAFVSYSHAGDGALAPRLQDGLQRFAKPWWRRRALRVFRDQTGLSVNPHLWSSIEAALADSDWFILMASPDATDSAWMQRELEHWKQIKGTEHILPVVTAGTWVWDDQQGDFDWEASTAVPEALRGVFASEPRHLEMQWARDERQLDLRNGEFRDQIAELAAPIRGLAKDDLIGDDIREHRRMVRTAQAVVLALLVLLVASCVGALLALNSSRQAQRERNAANAANTAAEHQAAVARENAAYLTVRVVASRLQEAARARGLTVDQNTANDWSDCMVHQLTQDRSGGDQLRARRKRCGRPAMARDPGSGQAVRGSQRFRRHARVEPVLGRRSSVPHACNRRQTIVARLPRRLPRKQRRVAPLVRCCRFVGLGIG